jgi:hypothetical protein
VSALVVHASKDREESTQALYTSPVIAVTKARILFKSGWRVHIIDTDGRIFHPEKFDEVLRFSPDKAADQILSDAPLNVGRLIRREPPTEIAFLQRGDCEFS